MKKLTIPLAIVLAVTMGCVSTHPRVVPDRGENPLVGVWDRLDVKGTADVDHGQIFIVRRDGTAVIKTSAWRRGIAEPPQSYSLDTGAQTITFKGIVFRYSFPLSRRLELLTLETEIDGKTIKQTYYLMTRDL